MKIIEYKPMGTDYFYLEIETSRGNVYKLTPLEHDSPRVKHRRFWDRERKKIIGFAVYAGWGESTLNLMGLSDYTIEKILEVRKDMIERARKRYHEDPEFREKSNKYCLMYKNQRRKNDPEYREKIQERTRKANYKRYHEDPEYRKKMQDHNREAYWKKKGGDKNEKYRRKN